MNDVLQMIANRMNNTKINANPPPKPPVGAQHEVCWKAGVPQEYVNI